MSTLISNLFCIVVWGCAAMVCTPALFAFDVREMPSGELNCGAVGDGSVSRESIAFNQSLLTLGAHSHPQIALVFISALQKFVLSTIALLVLSAALILRMILISRARDRLRRQSDLYCKRRVCSSSLPIDSVSSRFSFRVLCLSSIKYLFACKIGG